MITKVINVNLHQPIYERLTAKQGDIASRYLLFHLLDGDKPFDLSNKTVRVYAIKPDKTEIFNDLTINDASKGYCTLELTSQCLASAGVVKMELYISQSGKVLTSIPFELEVIACINTVNSVTSTNEFSALEVALSSLQDYDNLRTEIIQARKKHRTVGKRLDNFDSQLDTKANLIMVENVGISISDIKKEISQIYKLLAIGNNKIRENCVLDVDFKKYNNASFPETIIDESGNNISVTLNGFSKTSVSGFTDEKSLYFDGIKDYCIVDNIDLLKISENFSIEMFVKLPLDNTNVFLLGKGATDNLDYSIVHGWTSNEISLFTNKYSFINGSKCIIDNTEYNHYLITVGKSGENSIIKTYLNGVLINSENRSLVKLQESSNKLVLGKDFELGSKFGRMYLKEFRIYNKELSAIEVAHNYTITTGKPSQLTLSTNKTEEYLINGVATFVYIPKSYNQSVENKWVIFNHGAGGYGSDISTSQCGTVLNDLLNAGYIVVGSNYTMQNCWGNQSSTDDMKNLQLFMKSKYNLEDKPYVFMQSMGGLVTVNAISKGILSPKAVFGVFPVSNLRNMYDANEWHWNIPEAYEIANPNDINEYNNKTSGCDPMLSDFNKYKNIPFLIFASYGDTAVNTSMNRDMFANKLKAVGGYIETVDTVGNHGDLSNYQSDKILDFLSKF